MIDFIRVRPRLAFKDIDQEMIMPMINLSLAQKINTIHIYANGYKLDEIQHERLRIDETEFDPGIPVKFTSEELSDPWVRIRPRENLVFHYHSIPGLRNDCSHLPKSSIALKRDPLLESEELKLPPLRHPVKGGVALEGARHVETARNQSSSGRSGR